jgi:hypothetical protein
VVAGGLRGQTECINAGGTDSHTVKAATHLQVLSPSHRHARLAEDLVVMLAAINFKLSAFSSI